MNATEQADELRKCGYIFRSFNNGTHLVIETERGCVCYYSKRGFYEGAATGRGFRKLLKDLQKIRGFN